MADAGKLPGDAMQEIVFDDKYEFVPPHRGNLWPWVLERVVGWRLRRQFDITAIEVGGVDRLKASIVSGDGIIVAQNHCRPSDPAVLGEVTSQAGCHVFGMASWNVFKVNALQTFLVRRLGGFSIYREGMDRAALNCAIKILEDAERPLVVFPEGMISRTNDHLNVLQNGVSLMARAAARKRASTDPPGRVVVHPTAVKYRFDGEIESSVSGVLAEIEARLSWQSQAQRPLLERVERIGQALLTLKEVEYLGTPQAGSIFDRRDRLIDSEPLFLDAINRIIVQEGQSPISEPENEEYLIGTTVNQTWEQLKDIRVLPKAIPEYIDMYDVVVKEVLSQRIDPQPGVVGLLNTCKELGIPKAVASSSLREWVYLKLNSIGLVDSFDAVLGGDDVKNGKPNPEIYLLAAKKLGFSAEECIAIEDSPVGISAAVASGAHTIAVRTYFTRNLDISQANTVVDSLEQFDFSLIR